MEIKKNIIFKYSFLILAMIGCSFQLQSTLISYRLAVIGGAPEFFSIARSTDLTQILTMNSSTIKDLIMTIGCRDEARALI